ncbi:hypothetical protein [Micromonospora sp. NPDC007220]|uniref:hypothetical protein n=1 Tax=Micromonospora sp. NPDC007220 TaxID=3154318 RepID=UPI0033CD0286
MELIPHQRAMTVSLTATGERALTVALRRQAQKESWPAMPVGYNVWGILGSGGAAVSVGSRAYHGPTLGPEQFLALAVVREPFEQAARHEDD